ncbi:MAG: flagellar assembly protein FliH [Oceanicoccus sp.]
MTRIPADQSQQFSSWDLPEVKQGQIIQVEKLKQRGPRGELINVAKDAVIYNSLTAAQLEDIANQAYEDVHEQAYQDGLKQGHTDGYQAGLEAGQQVIAQQTQSLSATIDNLLLYLAGQDDQVEQALVNVATCIASAVLRRELTLDASHMQQIVSEAIAALPFNASNITVHLNVEDHQFLTKQGECPDHWQLQIDRTLAAGGCRVQTENSVVDFTLEEQFQQTVNSLVERRFAELAAPGGAPIEPSGTPAGDS